MIDVGDAVALAVGGRLCLLRVVTAIDDNLALADETDLRRRVVIRSRREVEALGERVTGEGTCKN